MGPTAPAGVVPVWVTGTIPPAGVASRKQRQLHKQIEKILDEREGDVHTVIVQGHAPDDHTARLMKAATESIRREAANRSARSLFPLSPDALLPGVKLRGYTTSRSAARPQLRTRTSARPSAASAKKANLQALRPLLALAQRPIVDDGGSARARRARSNESGALPLWAARSVVLRLTTDELWRLPDASAPIAGVFPNRKVRIPPIARTDAAQLPWEVQENKASTWGLHTIGALAVWGAYGARGAGSKVAILDTGVDDTHPDLQDASGKKKVTDFAQFADDGSQVAGAVPHDSDEHGTHCSGTVAGGNASGRWIGVAPEATLAMGLVLDAGFGTDAGILAGMEWAIDLDVDVISMSLGGFSSDIEMPPTYTEAMINAYLRGIPVAVAIGNDGSQTAGSPGSDLFALTIGATDHRDRAAGFSGGRTLVCSESPFVNPDALPLVYSKPDVSAPGVDVLSSIPNGEYDVFNGTSMATPHTAGAIALLLSATDIKKKTSKDDKRTELILSALMGSAMSLGEAGQNHRFGWGRIDVLKAVGFVKEAGF